MYYHSTREQEIMSMSVVTVKVNTDISSQYNMQVEEMVISNVVKCPCLSHIPCQIIRNYMLDKMLAGSNIM